MKRLLTILLLSPVFLKAQHVRSRTDTLFCLFSFQNGAKVDTISGYMLTFKTGNWATGYPKDTVVFTDRKFLRIPNQIVGYRAKGRKP